MDIFTSNTQSMMTLLSEIKTINTITTVQERNLIN